jgi:hypothetical protein
MPIVKQPSNNCFRSQKFSKQETAVFKLLLEENKASEIAKIMRGLMKTIGSYGCSKNRAKLLYVFIQ